jgi:hypothetical protein
MLPTFLLCGAQKAGTTAVYSALCQHPDICMSRPKETEFFNWRYDRGTGWFSKHFDHYSGEKAIGEASTRTMPTPDAPGRIYSISPNIRLIFILRDPVKRAYSAYWFYLTNGIICSTEKFSNFIRNEGHPLRQEIIEYGHYDHHLKRFNKIFPLEQLLVLFYEDLMHDISSQLQNILRFIDIDATKIDKINIQKKNVTSYPVSKSLYSWMRSIWKPISQKLELLSPSLVEATGKYSKKILMHNSRPQLSVKDELYLRTIYKKTVTNLEKEHGYDLTHWK